MAERIRSGSWRRAVDSFPVVPDWAGAMFLGRPAATPLHFEEGRHAIERGRGLIKAPAALLDETFDFSAKPGRRIVDAHLPQRLFLKRTIRFPKAGRRNLGELVQLDLVRRTPFAWRDVETALSPVRTAPGGLEVDQWVVHKDALDKIRARLADAGFLVRRVLVADAPGAVVADHAAEVAPSGRRRRRINAGLAASAVVLAAVAFALPPLRAASEVRRMQALIAALREEAVAARAALEADRAQETEKAAFLALLFARPTLSNTLSDLTEALPDEAWASELTFLPERVVVAGETKGSAAELVLELAENGVFENPRLSGPISRTDEGAELFEITLDVGSPG